jgi:nucleoside-diphosphate kinase
MKPERTLILLKPDTIQRGFMGEVLTRFERVGMKFVGLKMVWINKDFSKEHYAEHVEKPFYASLEEYILKGPVLAAVLEGAKAIEVVRKMVGLTDPSKAVPGTIRGDYSHMAIDYANETGKIHTNIIHASANASDAAKEVSLWFKDIELHSYKTAHESFCM